MLSTSEGKLGRGYSAIGRDNRHHHDAARQCVGRNRGGIALRGHVAALSIENLHLHGVRRNHCDLVAAVTLGEREAGDVEIHFGIDGAPGLGSASAGISIVKDGRLVKVSAAGPIERVEIVTASGAVVAQLSSPTGSLTIDTAGLADGVYVVRAVSDKQTTVSKFIL